MGSQTIRKKILSLKKRKLAASPVVSLKEFRDVDIEVSPYKILVVDSDEVVRSALKRLLEKAGYSVLLAEDGVELARVLENSYLDLILMEIELPWVDGFELCKILKENIATKDVPIVLMSVRQDSEGVRSAFSLGAEDYITKPFDLDVVLTFVKKKIEAKKGRS